MDYAFEIAGRTLQIGTKGHRLSFILHEWGTANWTMLWEMINLLFASTPLDDGFHYLRYYFTCSLDKYPVTNAQILALDVTFVVKRSARNSYTAYIDRLK